MDHSLYLYSPVPKRAPIKWPNGAHLAFCIYLYFEFMEFDQPMEIVRDPRLRDRPRPDCREYSWYEYGNRVAIFRILDALDKYGFKATVAANSEACRRFPYLVDIFQQRGYEFVGHGITANRMISSRMSEAEERAAIGESLSQIEAATGTKPRGWISQDYGESTRTPGLLAEAGLDYVADWPNDDQPYRMSVGRDFVSLPNHSQWDDLLLLWDRRMQMPRYPQIVGEGFDRLLAEGGESGRFFSLGVHPWLMGAAHRIQYFEEVLARIARAEHVWQTTGGSVVDYILASASANAATSK
jgi:peptidoglycan/xylan/chitin deacetylase (PgdA/CDA1 family)